MRKLVLIVIVLLFCINFTHSADVDWDCVIVLSKDTILSDRDTASEDDVVKTNLNLAMPKEAMEKAFDNLKSYCCDLEKISSNYCEDVNNDVFYPQSVYLFDHILDVYLRRLDAKQKNDNWNDLLYNLEPDEMWLEWRTFVTEHGNDINWSLPLQIQKTYEKFWHKNIQVTPSFMEINGAVQGNWLSDTVNAIKLYDTWTLFDKYNLACDVSNYISISTWIQLQWLVTNEYNACKDLVKNRIDNEKVYVQVILSQKWEKLLWSNMDAYLGTYFVNKKLSELMQTVFNISTSFSEINKAVAKLIPECS